MGRSLIDTASYDPDTLKMLGQAFDDVWREMAANYHAQAMIEDRRNRLATIILGLADGGERDLTRHETPGARRETERIEHRRTRGTAPANCPF